MRERWMYLLHGVHKQGIWLCQRCAAAEVGWHALKVRVCVCVCVCVHQPSSCFQW